MRRLILPGNRAGSVRFVLDEKTSRYLTRVLRLGEGEVFPALDEAGNEFSCEVAEASPKATAILLSPEAAPGVETAGGLRLALVQALPKGQKMDLIVRQAAESGVAAIFPLQTRNCVVREKDEAEKMEKLLRRRKIVREALQQSGSTVRTKIYPSTPMEALPVLLSAEGFPADTSLYLMCHELPLAERGLHEYCAGSFLSAVILIGPEGGFSPEETGAFRRMGFEPVHFEGTILRTETAALFSLAAVKTILMERTSWTLSK